MISKQQVKFVKSLKLKKYRKKAASFLVEGVKNVVELINSDYEVEQLFVTEKFLAEFPDWESNKLQFQICSERELVGLGTFQSNEYAVAVAKIKVVEPNLDGQNILLALDSISDPGNLGTILRIADWYGINTILASHDTADFYNPKVINASMGSFTRVNLHYMNLEDFFAEHQTYRVYGAVLDGENIHREKFTKPMIILLGNESKGISAELERYIDKKITIPRIGRAESLNVAVSAAIICDNIFRN